MTQDPVGYNHGRYDFQQQSFCLSMLTCLSFNLTDRSAEAIALRFRGLVENVLKNDAAIELIGRWKLVWGPVVYADAFVGAKTGVNSMFIAAPEAHPDQLVVAITGTNGNSLMGWMLEDFNVKEKVAWPYGETALKPHLSKGVAYGFDKLLGLVEPGANKGATVSARDYLAAHPEITKVMVTGHSLGGALAAVYSLYLENTRAEWNPSGSVALSCLATAGQTPGDADFSQFYGEKLAHATTRVWNSLDIVPHAFEKDKLPKIPSIYEPHFPAQKSIKKFLASIQRETEANHYVNIMPEVAGFPSTFMRLEDIAGDKYRPFVDFVDNIVNMVKKLNAFGAAEVVGSLQFVVHALVQHIFPYFTHFKIDDFIKVMCAPPVRSEAPPAAPTERRSFWKFLTSVWERVKSVFKKKDSN